MQETQVESLFQEDSMEEGMQPTPGRNTGVGCIPSSMECNPLQYSCLENPMDRGNWLAYNPWDCKESDTKAHSRTKNFKGTNNKASLCSLIFPQMCDLWSQKYTLIFKFTFRQQ